MSIFRQLMMAQNVKPYRELQYIGYRNVSATQTLIRLAQKFSDCDKFTMRLKSSVTGMDMLLGDGFQDGYGGYFGFASNAATTPAFYCNASIPYTIVPVGWSVTDKSSGTWQTIEVSYNGDAVNPPSVGISFGGYQAASFSKEKFLSYIKTYKNNVLLGDYIACLWSKGKTYIDGNTGQTIAAAADKPGLYDQVSGKFFVNQGSGPEFLYA